VNRGFQVELSLACAWFLRLLRLFAANEFFQQSSAGLVNKFPQKPPQTPLHAPPSRVYQQNDYFT